MWRVCPCGSVYVRRQYQYVEGVRWIVVYVGRGGGFLYHHTKDTGRSPVDYCPYKEPLLLLLRDCFAVSSRLLRLAQRILWATSGGCLKPVMLEYFIVLNIKENKNVVNQYFKGFVNIGLILFITK